MAQQNRTILVFGKNGQVGQEIRNLVGQDFSQSGKTWIFAAREDVDLTDADSLTRYLDDQKPDAIINASAYTAVDKAESDVEAAFAVNAKAPEIMAVHAKKLGIPFIHISTDYVFDGTKSSPYVEDDAIHPLGAYGASKAEGEKAVIATGANAVILRTSWVYAVIGKNFVHTMLKFGQERDAMRVVNDQIGAPTNARDIAKTLLGVLEQMLSAPQDMSKAGLYHMTARGYTSWHGFAAFIFEKAKSYGLKTPNVLEAIPASEYPTPAKRPSNSRLDCTKLEQVFGIALPQWEDSANSCLDEILDHTQNIQQQKVSAS